jgi:hypothetical protein
MIPQGGGFANNTSSQHPPHTGIVWMTYGSYTWHTIAQSFKGVSIVESDAAAPSNVSPPVIGSRSETSSTKYFQTFKIS